MVTGLFDHLRFLPDNKAVTYSGLASDLPRLTLASMEYGLSLPSQLQSGHRVRPGEIRPHCDLALELKGNGRDWTHLSEIGLRMGLPWQLFADKTEVNRPQTAKQWLDVRQHVSFDTVLTAMITMGWLKAQGRSRIDVPATIYHLAEWYIRKGKPSLKLRKGPWVAVPTDHGPDCVPVRRRRINVLQPQGSTACRFHATIVV